MFVTGKGLSGGLYPVSALLMRQEFYEHCLNRHPFAYISSLGGNEIGCLVAQKVLALSSDPAFLAHVERISTRLHENFANLCKLFPDVVAPGTALGCIQTLRVCQAARAAALYRAFHECGVLCHSVSTIEPTVLKFFPTLTMSLDVVDEIAEKADAALRRFQQRQPATGRIS
jgi:acetylornithine aminotransferase